MGQFLTLAAETTSEAPSLSVTLLFAALLVGMIVALALEEKLHAKKSLIVALFAIVGLLLADGFGLLPLERYASEHMPIYIPAIDWEIIAIILGSSLFVDVTSRSGLFTWIAIKLTKVSRGDPLLLLIFYGVMTVVFSAVLNNVTAMIIVGSLTVVSLEKLGRREKLFAFLLVEGLLTNVGGLLTLISSVPNIIVGNAANITFVKFFIVSCPYVVVATVVTLFMGAKLFGIRRLSGEQERSEALRLVGGFDENDGIESRGFFWFGAIMMVLFIGVVAGTSEIPYLQDLGLGYVALTFAAIMLIRFRAVADKFYQAIDWDLLAFFAGLFIVINVMEHAHVLALIGQGMERVLELPDAARQGTVLIGSGVFSAVTDNIPLAAMIAKIFSGLEPKLGPNDPLWWSVVFGANLGGNITPIGSASTLVAVTIMHKHGLPVTFLGFVKKALPFAAVQLVLAVLYVLLYAAVTG